MKTTLSTVFLLAVAAYANAQQELAYFSHKGKAFDVDGFDANSYSYTGFNKYGKDKYGRSYTEPGSGNGAPVDAGGRNIDTSATSVTSTGDVDPTESGDWENYWPSFKEGGERIHKKAGIKRAGNGKIIDKAWYHLSNRPAPTVTETQTQFEFTEIYITSSVAPTEDFWCDGGWIQITKEGDLMDDEWAVAYITGYLQIIGANVDDVDTYDWCVNTKDNNTGAACAFQQAASHSPADIAAAFAQATDDHTSQIILFVCDLPCLDSICVATQENYSKLTPLRLKEITFTKTTNGARNVSTPCLDGDGIYSPPSDKGKTYKFCPQGQKCTDGASVNPGNPDCLCQACGDLEFCLSTTCVVNQTAVPPATDPVWEETQKCIPVNGDPACELGYYQGADGLCTQCPPVDNCLQVQCTSADNAMCYGPCEGTYFNTAAPGGAGMCICDKKPASECDRKCTKPNICAQLTLITKDLLPQGATTQSPGLEPQPGTRFTIKCLDTQKVINGVTNSAGIKVVEVDPCTDLEVEFENSVGRDGQRLVIASGQGSIVNAQNNSKIALEAIYVAPGTTSIVARKADGVTPVTGATITSSEGTTEVTQNGGAVFSTNNNADYTAQQKLADGCCLVSNGTLSLTPSNDQNTNNKANSVGQFTYGKGGELVVKLVRDDGITPIVGQTVEADVGGTVETLTESPADSGIYVLSNVQDGALVFILVPNVAQDSSVIYSQPPGLANPPVYQTSSSPLMFNFHCSSDIIAFYGAPLPISTPSPSSPMP